jgi:hypothetical protein
LRFVVRQGEQFAAAGRELGQSLTDGLVGLGSQQIPRSVPVVGSIEPPLQMVVVGSPTGGAVSVLQQNPGSPAVAGYSTATSGVIWRLN